jgi:hypothetical protein
MTQSNNQVADYRYLVIAQVIILCSYMLIEDILKALGWDFIVAYIKLYYLLLAGTYGILLWNIVRHSSKQKWLIYTTGAIIVLLFILVSLLENPFTSVFSDERPYFFCVHVLLFSLEISVIVLAIQDLFYTNAAMSTKLWASACIYFTLAIAFGGLYDTINIIKPGSFGKEVDFGFASYITGISYSLNIIGGMDPTYEVSEPMHRLGSLQSIWCNLYLVLLIGQVLGGGSPPQKSE